MKKLLALAITTLFVSSPVLATELDFSPDRPGFSDSVGVTPQGKLVTEMGVSVAVDGNDTNGTLPNILIKVGVIPNLELRAVIPGTTFYRNDARFGDIGVGMKLGAETDRLAFSLVPTLWVPMYRGTSDDDCFCTKDSYGTMNFNVEIYPTDDLWLGVNAIVLDVNALSGAVGYSIDDWGLFAQAYTIEDGGTFTGLGMTYIVSSYVQVDLGIDVGVRGDVAPVNVYTGLAYMWQ